jgi:DNA-directed RNA polymerase specialized sigma24 family protein
VTAQGDDMIDVLTIEEVAERLRVSVLTVRWLRQEGRFALRSRLAVAWYGMLAT